ncbi:MAG TPA: hypothetical protein VGF70_14200 [Solirubrobacteraceae bacterium]|jgi:hypothetical protein
MSFMDRAKAAAEQVRARAQEGVEEVQTRKELAQGYWDLGHKAYELASAGALSHPELDPLVQRMGELLARDEAEGSTAPPAEPGPATTPPPDTPA